MSEPIRVLNLFTILNRGGAESMVMNYYRKIDRSKIQFDFLVHRQERGAFEDEIESLGGRIFRICPLYPHNFIRYKKEIARFFDQHTEYKIIHSHMSESGYFAFREAAKRHIPVRICHAHNTPVYTGVMLEDRLKAIFRYYFKYRIRSLTTDFFMCSKDAGDWLFGDKYQNCFVRMNNAIDAQKFRYDGKTAQEVRKEFGWENKFVIGHVGRFNVQKNHTFLIDVFNEYSKSNPNALLVLVGTGELEPTIKNKVERLSLIEKVSFWGSCANMPDLYKAFDLFLFPSLFEGLSVALVEAQASGLPCLISNNISNETFLTNRIEPISLSLPPKVWATHIKKYEHTSSSDTYFQIVKKHFDIVDNSKWLTNFYLNASERI